LNLDKVARFLLFVAELKHYKGQWAGQTIALQPHQVFRLGSMFGWVHTETGLRRFRRAYHEIPRKNGKSLEAAIVALYMTFFDGEGGADGYCAATKKDQAKIVWGDAEQLVKSSILRVGIECFARSLCAPTTMSKLEPLGSDSDSTDGLNPHLIIQDEFHAYKDRKMIDVLETATGARQQPMDMRITTAGDDPVSPGGDEHNYACQVLEQVIDDEQYFAFIAHADPADDWMSVKTWKKANPNYGVSVQPDDLEALCRKAKNMPAAAATFQQKRLNLWVNTSAPWLSLDGWRKGQTTDWTPADLLHESCFAGVDLASKLDLCPLVLVFPPTVGRASWKLLRWVWTPEETLLDRAHRDRAPYDLWHAQTLFDRPMLETTPGTNVDHQVIRGVLGELRKLYDIERIGFDPWHADTLIEQLVNEDGFDKEQVLAVPQTYAGMSSGAKKFEAEVLAGHVDAGGCPLMAWCASNVVVQRDGKDNIYPVKKKSRGRIDPIMAAIIGVNLALRLQQVKAPGYQMLVLGGSR
jgi:phage terminase large subunit-like protein